MPWYNPDEPRQRYLLLGGLVALALIFVFRSFWLTPRQASNDELRQRVEQLETVNRRAEVLAAQGGGDLQERLALYERHVARLEELIPGQEEVPVLLDDIQGRARLERVDVRLLEPQPREQGEHYTRTSYNMSVVGEYHSVARFLTRIASLDRIVTPVQVDIQLHNQAAQYPDLQSPVVASFRIETYVLPDSSTAPPPAQIGG